ncbi:MAG: class I SAM-dependent DNA methyltransferase [Deltaproteobacteria bacterium]|nr:class I SAM-dependent DNA methyltransferase [Deltaproteobacteria bacterium]
MPKRGRKPAAAPSGALIGIEETLWLAADKLRGSMDPGEYKHVVLGLLFLKYVSDAFDERRAAIEAEGGDVDDRDEYTAEEVFFVPEKARWKELQKHARQPDIGTRVDAAMEAIEKDNAVLRGVLPKDYARPQLDKRRLGELVDLFASVTLYDKNARAKDLLGRVYEYFLKMFASAEGRLGGDFYTPQSVVRTLVELIEPTKGRVFDPCCGSGGMFVQSERFVEAHGGRRTDISIYGQEWNATTWRLAKMNLAIRGISANLGPRWGDSFHDDQHADLRADYVLANPPFNISDWGGERLASDARWKYGVPPAGNANYAWLQHILARLSDRGVAGVVLANGSMSSQQNNEGAIRKSMIEADVVDCMVALPGQLFYATPIPVCLWILAKNKRAKGLRARAGEVLFIDARKMGRLVDRTHRELTEDDVAKIARAYHAWRGEKDAGEFRDEPGFCKSATREEIAKHECVLTPGRYVGAEEVEDDGEPFEAKMKRLVGTLETQFEEGERLQKVIRKNLRGLGYGR